MRQHSHFLISCFLVDVHALKLELTRVIVAVIAVGCRMYDTRMNENKEAKREKGMVHGVWYGHQHIDDEDDGRKSV